MQLKVCTRRCLSEAVGSEYLFTSSPAILFELSFKQLGHAYITFYVNGAQLLLAAFCPCPVSGILLPWQLFRHILFAR